MPPDNGVKLNGKVPWAVVVTLVGAIVTYGILLGQVAQIDARLARVEAAMLGRQIKPAIERMQDAKTLVDVDARRSANRRVWQRLHYPPDATAAIVRRQGTRGGEGR
jgi:hypothetical protein